MNASTAFRFAAIFGFLAVALGAFGAHGLKATLEQHAQFANWQTAAHYHLVHSVVLLAISRDLHFSRAAWFLFAAGILVFCGSLYTLAATNTRWLGAITPLGGVALLGGWLVLALRKTPERNGGMGGASANK
ncbi:MAG TPA: DUF423 domain-containing protein [Chthoniobacteraceae bacterium]|nr:DUF423 domain-containing protein [Chthoniobacteraceae bacterium]